MTFLRGPVRRGSSEVPRRRLSHGKLRHEGFEGGAVLERRFLVGVEAFSVGGGGEHCGGLTVRFAELKPWRLFAAANAVRQPEPEPGTVSQSLVVASICSQNVVWAEWPIVRDGEKPLQSFNIGNDLLNIHTHSIAKATSRSG
jgi:hypothetical protein